MKIERQCDALFLRCVNEIISGSAQQQQEKKNMGKRSLFLDLRLAVVYKTM